MMEIDALTGVYTRKAFFQHAEEMMKANPEKSYDIVLSDFVNFKHFNARYGNETGDLLLKKTGEMLSMSGPEVVIGRYGADRFVSLVQHLDEFGIAVLENFQLPEQAKDELPVESVVVKFGICADISSDEPVSVFCDRAYLALQSVKHQYEKNVGIYTAEIGNAARQELFIEENMKSSLEKGEFKVFYQPKMDAKTETICGAEALVRWKHPGMGYMNPGEFIPVFEKNGFIKALDRFVWEQVCKDLTEWKSNGYKVVPVSVNASRRDFEENNPAESIIALVNSYSVEPQMLHIEVTESSYAEDPACVGKNVDILHEAGFTVELDDFGSGFTSLSALNDMKVDILKLDMSLIRNDDPSSGRSALDFAMQLARMMGLKTIQEGVETEGQLNRLRSLGCDYIQGYYFAKPMPKEEYEEFIK